MKNLRKDKFEEFMKESLGDYGENPSDRLWEELEPKIPKPDNGNKHLMGWIVLLLLFFLFTGGYFWKSTSYDMTEVNLSLKTQEEKINKIAQEVEKINSTLNDESISTTHNKIEDNEISSKQISSNNKNSTDKIKTSKTQQYNYKNIIPQKNNYYQSKGSSNSFSDSGIIQLTKSKSSLEKTASQKIQIKSPVLNLNKKINTEITNELQLIPSIYGKLTIPNRKLNSIDLIDFVGPKQQSGFEFFTSVGTNYPQIKLESPINRFNKNAAKNFDIGFLYNIPLKGKWLVQVGIGYTQRKIGTNFSKDLQYGNIETLITNNQYQSKNSYTVNSNYGRQIFTSYFTNTKMSDGLDIEAGDLYSANFNLIRTQKYFSIPLIVKYQFSDPYKKLRWSAKAGVFDRIFFDVNDNGVVTVENISHPRLEHQQTVVENLTYQNVATQYGIELMLGAGIEYQFHKHFMLIIEPVFKSNVFERTPVNPYSLGLYSGIRWTFDR